MAQKNIVIIGAGFAGIYATKKLAKYYKKHPDYQITLIDKHSYFTYLTELHEVAANRVPEDHVQHDLQHLFCRRKNVKLVTDTVTRIDRANKTVITEHGRYAYDQVILGIGSEPNDFGTPGVAEYGFTLGSWEQAVALKQHIIDVVRRGAIEHDPEKRRALLNIVVVGSGFTGTETIGELRDWRDELAADNKLDPEEIQFTMMEMAPTIMNMLDRNDAAKAERYMAKQKINVRKNTGVTGVHEMHIDLNDDSTFPTATLIWTAGVKASSQAAQLGLTTGKAGRIVTNKFMQSVDDDKIYVVGDVAFFDETDDGRGQPQIVQGAEASAATALKNIIATEAGQEKVPYKGNYSGFMVSIGSRYAVANLMNFFHLSGFFATFVKHLVNMLYFIQIYSGYDLFHYSMNEFFRTKNDRNLMRGHISRYGNVLWTVPARLFLGAMWLVDCWDKVQGEGSWFTNKLRLPFDWLQPAVTSGASKAADATSAASGAASSGATEPATAKVTFGLSYLFGHDPMPVFDKMPHWFYSITKVLIPNQEVAFFMQKTMTIIEILIGLALIAGLFTWLTSAATIAMVITFCLSGMFYWVNIWIIPMALACMNGSGRALGLDKWVVPYLQKHLGRWRYGQQRALYKNQ